MDLLVADHDGYSEPPLDMDYINNSMSFIPSERCTISCGTVCVDPRASKVLIIYNRRLGIWQLPKGRKNIGEDLPSAALRETHEETGIRPSLLPLKIHTRSTAPCVASDCDYNAEATAPRSVNDAPSHRTTPSTASASSASTAHSTSIASVASVASVASTAPSLLIAPLAPISPGRVPFGADREASLQSEQHAPRADGTVTATATATAEATTEVTSRVADPKLTCDVFNNEPVGIVRYHDVQAATPNTTKTVFFYAAFADSTAAMGPGAQEDHEDLQAEWVGFQVAGDRLRFGAEKDVMWKVWRDMERSGFKC